MALTLFVIHGLGFLSPLMVLCGICFSIRVWMVVLNFLKLVKFGGKTSDELILGSNHDSEPITMSACVDSITVINCAGFPGVLID